jgi:hypothetical protein
VRGKDDRAEARPCMNLYGMYRWFGVVPQGLFEFFPVFLFGDFQSLFLAIFLRRFWDLSLWDLVGNIFMSPFEILFPLIPLPNPWVKGLNFGVFVVLGLVVFLAEILRFLCWRKIRTLRQAHSKPNKLASHAKRFQDVPVNFPWKLTKDKVVKFQSLELAGWYQTVPYLRP